MWKIFILIFSRPLPSPLESFLIGLEVVIFEAFYFTEPFSPRVLNFADRGAFCKIRQNLDKNCRALGQESVQGQTDEIYHR